VGFIAGGAPIILRGLMSLGVLDVGIGLIHALLGTVPERRV